MPVSFRRSIVAGLLIAVSAGLNATPSSAAPGPADAERAWQVILEQAAGPGARQSSPDAAAAAIRSHLDKQEKTLRDFAQAFPDDPHRYSARIRLAAVLAAKGRFVNSPALNAESVKILADLETNPATPAPVRADAGFARVSQAMQDLAVKSGVADREDLMKQVRRFDADYPGDRRVPGLLTELANLYDEEPTEKKAILNEASTRTADPALRDRIADDLRRIDMLGRPLELRFQPSQGGAPFDLAARRGRVIVILFWASWSMPALHELAHLQRTAQEFEGRPVEFLTVSLDEDRSALAAAIVAADLRWPVQCDGRGWKGEQVRALGINALPTVWVLDRGGNLLDLNARGEQTASLIRKALKP